MKFVSKPAGRGIRLAAVAAAVLLALAAARIAGTYTVYSQVVDESAHLATGMEWLDRGRYEYEPLHPPLARVAIALGPYLDGLRSHGDSSFWDEGNRILEDRGTYSRNLALARLGTLPFFLAAGAVVWFWARWLFGPMAAVAGVLLLTLVPPVLGHGGLATTDMATAATLPAALLVFLRWLRRPSVGWSVALGVAVAAALLTKLSILAFLPAGGLAILAWRWVARRGVASGATEPVASPSGSPGLAALLGRIALAGAVCAVTVWAGYRFSISYPETFGGRVPFPAAEFLRGLRQLYDHSSVGHPSYFLGELRQTGWWYYFPVVFLMKTPLPFVLFAAIGIAAALRKRPPGEWRTLAAPLAAGAVMAVSMTSSINIGVRHILPVYPLLAVIAGHGVVSAWQWGRQRTVARAATAGLLAWLVVSSARSYPDHLTYFNELAGGRPENIVVDSDLCWGQDYFRLVDAVRERGIDSIWVAYHGRLEVERHRLPAMHTLAQHQRVTGWVAASIFELKGVRRKGYLWLNAYQPVGRAGDSIWLFYIPDGPEAAPARP